MGLEEMVAKIFGADKDWKTGARNAMYVLLAIAVFSLAVYNLTGKEVLTFYATIYLQFFALMATLYAQKASSEKLENALTETNTILNEIGHKLDILVEEVRRLEAKEKRNSKA